LIEDHALRIYSRTDLTWNGLTLRLGTKIVATVVPDLQFQKMYRVQPPDGTLTDMVNLSRAKDAAISLALSELNKRDWKEAAE
jgi:hypothetical protein